MDMQTLWANARDIAKRLFFSNSGKKLIDNFLSLSAIQFLSQLTNLIVLPYLIRIVDADGFGIIQYAMSYILFAQVTVMYGFNNTAMRRVTIIGENPDQLNELYGNVSAAKFFLAAIVGLIYALIFLFAPIDKIQSNTAIFFLLLTGVAAEAFSPQWLFLGLEKMRYMAFLHLAAKVLTVVFTFILVQEKDDVIIYAALLATSAFVSGVGGMWLAWKQLGLFPTKFSISGAVEQLREGFQICISVLFIHIYTSTRLIILGFFASERLIGLFAVGDRISSALQLFPASLIVAAAMPRLMNIHNSDPEKSLRYTRNIQFAYYIYAIFLAVAVYIAAPYIVRLATGHEYLESITTLRLLIVASMFVLFNSFRSTYLINTGRYHLFAKIHIVAGIFGVVQLTVLTSAFSYIGLACGVVLQEFSLTAATIWVLKKEGITI